MGRLYRCVSVCADPQFQHLLGLGTVFPYHRTLGMNYIVQENMLQSGGSGTLGLHGVGFTTRTCWVCGEQHLIMLHTWFQVDALGGECCLALT